MSPALDFCFLRLATMPKKARSNLQYVVQYVQGCILLTYLSVISSKFIQKFAQKCQYFTLIDQSVPLDNCYVTCLLREKSALNMSKLSQPVIY
jgi:hypothetical protein